MKYEIRLTKDECWWGGTSYTKLCPITENSEYHQDFRLYCLNQTAPFFVSSKGRYIWSDNPFKVDASDGLIRIEGTDVELVTAGSTLREAYLDASSKHFPCDRRSLPELFFKEAQYCTWIECAYWVTQDKVLKYAQDILNHGMNPGILIIDEGWFVNGLYGQFEFDPIKFPDPKGMVEQLHNMGFVVMLWVAPFICPNGLEFVKSAWPLDGEEEKNLFMRTKTGEIAIQKWWDGFSGILDFTKENDRQYMRSRLDRLMNEYGIDGFKFDGGETRSYSTDIINGEPDDSRTQYDRNIAYNDFGTSYGYHEFKDTYMFGGRNSIARLHDRCHAWEGRGIDDILPCTFVAGLLGHPFICPDMVGGGEWRDRYSPSFHIDEELFVRMAQCSVLFPMIQYSWAPWEALSDRNMKLCLDVEKIREENRNKLLEIVKESEQTGEPIIRLLEYNDPGQGFQTIDDEYMVGEEFLVAPVVTKGTRERTVVFPKGTWVDSDGMQYEGRTKQILQAPLEKVLWFKRK